MLARLGGLDGPLGVLRMRGGDVDCLDPGIGQQRLIGAVAGGNAELCSERRAFSCDRDPTAASSPVSEAFTPRANALAIAPVASNPQRIFLFIGLLLHDIDIGRRLRRPIMVGKNFRNTIHLRPNGG